MGSLFRMSEALNLHFTTYGDASRPTLIILHGLLGSSDNWHSIARRLSDHFHVCTIDARNHGRSPHSEEFDYPVMVNDVVNFMYRQKRATASLLGHSMGGKTAAWMALLHPELIEKLIVVDIAVRSYQAHHDRIFDALTTLNLRILQSRKEVDQALSDRIPEPHVRQFLLKNLLRDEQGVYRWKMNLDVIEKKYPCILEAVPSGRVFTKPTLFIRGENSDYIQMEDLPSIAQVFPSAELVTIAGAGHWVHADNQDDFITNVADFLVHS